MPQTRQVTVQKEQLLSDYAKLKQWLTHYWHFLENFPLDIFSNDEQVVEYLREQHQKLVETNVKLQTLEMTGSVLAFALERINPKELIFRVPVETHPQDYKEITDLSASVQHIESVLQGIVEQVMYLSRHLPPESEEKFTPLLRSIGSLFKSIIRQDGDDMKLQLTQINLLSSTKESQLLVAEVGKVTREIFESLQDFSEDLDTEKLQLATDEMPDAVQKINSVIDKLEEAANDNLEFLESLIQQSEHNVELLEDLGATFNQLDQMLTNLGEKHQELGTEVQKMKDLIHNELVSKKEALINTFHENENLYLTIMTNQGFQDLTGQTLKKIVDFIEKLELRLLELIQKFGKETKSVKSKDKTDSNNETMTRIDKGIEGEEVHLHGPDESETKKSTQSDVDSLLADMGF
ncbi:MAG: protein phosphatase CheZ [SAR324 cluster bacterium]|nr:protein phosphatase CheZ [SAR324 cluster bacterium]